MPADIQALESFIAEPKFGQAAWKRRGLNPSPPALCARLESSLNEMAGQLVAQARAGAKESEVKQTLTRLIRRTDRSAFDTEEAEFFCAEVARLSRIVGVDAGPSLNRWLYGFPLGVIVNLTRRKA